MHGGIGERLAIGVVVAFGLGLAGWILLVVLPLIGIILTTTLLAVAVVLLGLAIILPFVILFGVGGVKGSGMERREVREVARFHEIHVAGALRTEIVRGGVKSVTFVDDENLVEHVETDMRDGALYVHVERRLRPRAELKVQVWARELDAVSTSGATKTSNTGIDTDRFHLNTSGAAKTTVAGRRRDAAIALSGAGKLDARELICDNVDIAVSGAGKASVHATERLAARIGGAGKIECYGRPKSVTREISGAGKIELK